METKRRVLIFGETRLLRALAGVLCDSALLRVEECHHCGEIQAFDTFHPDAILVDAAQVTPEQFQVLLARYPSSHTTLISVDPLTYQLTVLSSPHGTQPLANAARIIEILSVSLSRPT